MNNKFLFFLILLAITLLFSACENRESTLLDSIETKSPIISFVTETTEKPPSTSVTRKWRRIDEIIPELTTEDTAFKNYEYNIDYWIKNGLDSDVLINGQALLPQSKLRLGDYSFEHNSCEVIATYNALQLLGIETGICELALEFEINAFYIKGGYFGSDPKRISRLFDEMELTYEKLNILSEAETAIQTENVMIISFWTGERMNSTIHTIAVQKQGDIIFAFNYYSDSDIVNKFNTIEEMIPKDSLIIAYKLLL